MRNVEFLKNITIAHRGLFDNKKVPENSLLSFKKAIKNNLAIELDLHLLKDNSVVVFHDNNLKRLTGINKELEDLNYSDINNLYLLNTKEHIPLFKEVLNLIKGEVPLIIELKTNNCLLVDKVMKLLISYKGEYCLKSFNPFLISYLKRHYPNVIRGLIITKYKKSFLKKIMYKIIPFNKILKLDFISCDIRTLPIKRKNIIILGWTIKSKEDYAKAKNYCDSFICENIKRSEK